MVLSLPRKCENEGTLTGQLRHPISLPISNMPGHAKSVSHPLMLPLVASHAMNVARVLFPLGMGDSQ